MVSVTHPSAPLRENIVRVHTHPSLLVISPRYCGTFQGDFHKLLKNLFSGNDTKVTSIIQAELHLMGLPTAVVESFIPKVSTSFGEKFYKARIISQSGCSKRDSYW
ncbi:unnamed protein product [Strongylus vulgaris]|uniref:Uncharacterized protein n=1 Tax=Strongylus vulgaris TaxID=40348 RepID=A0A3P7J3M6_STRVU|nr:unnamed protein product [Strongylus vulgaris]